MHTRFFVSQKIGDAREAVIADKDIRHQIGNVLRRSEGDIVNLLDNSGYEYRCVIKSIDKDGIVLEMTGKELNVKEPRSKVTLYQSVIKKDKMEWVFEKCAEVGVSRFVPMISEHSVKLGINIQRAEKILKEAAEQCGRGKIPYLSDVVLYKEAVAQAKAGGFLNVFLHNQGISGTEIDFPLDGANLFIGPEGGFSDAEVGLAKESGFKIVSLGARTFRSETAAVIASFLAVK